MPSESRGSYGAPHYEVWEVVYVAGGIWYGRCPNNPNWHILRILCCSALENHQGVGYMI